MFYLAVLLKTWVQDTASQIALGDSWKEVSDKSEYTGVSVGGGKKKKERKKKKKKTPGIQRQTITANCIFKTRHLNLMNLSLFYVWEDARVWTYWNYSLDVHLSNLLPVFQFSPFWVPYPQGVLSAVAAVADGLMVGSLFTEMAGDTLYSYTSKCVGCT